MIAIVTIVFLSVSVLLSTFLGFSPNFYKLTESDFMRRVDTNTIIYGLQFGEVAMRAKSFPTADKKPRSLPLGYVKKKNTTELDDMTCKLTMSTAGKIQITLEYKSPK